MAQPRFHAGEAGSHARRGVDYAPTVLRIGGYRFFFYSNENAEPAHIHVRSADGEAKFWLSPVKPAWNQGYNERERRQIEHHIADNLDILIKAWVEFFEEEHDE